MIRFIILGYSRTGSTLLQTSIDEHPDAEVHGELLHDDDEDRRDGCRIDDAYYRTGTDAAAFLRRTVFRRRTPPAPAAVGFKFLYYHARSSPKALRAWDYVVADRDIRIIHLVRWNLLDCFVSHEVARRTDEWVLPHGALPGRQVPAFHVPPERFLGFCEHVATWVAWARRAFARHHVLSLGYEQDLVGRYQDAMALTYDFLGLPPRIVLPPVRKQATRRSREQLTNYDELRIAARHTLFEDFFEEPPAGPARRPLPARSRGRTRA